MADPTSPATRPATSPTWRLRDAAQWLGVAAPAAEVTVSGLSLSTERIRPGDIYAALPGTRAHGARYADKAVAAGAVAILTDSVGADLLDEAGVTVPRLVVTDPRRTLGPLAARLYDEPATSMTLIGVTGTQGKTTTTRLLESGLQAAEIPAAVIGTVGTRIRGAEVKTSLTTPEAPDLQALFAVMRERAVQVCAMEVSSHALVLGRVDGVVFDVACFLNLGRDHLDFHTDIEDYFRAKARLFVPAHARQGLVNLDDPYGRRLLEDAAISMSTFSATGGPADWRASQVRLEPGGADFVVHGPGGLSFPARAPLAGGFNVANTLCAIAAAGLAGLDAAAVARGIAAGSGVPGRLESVPTGAHWAAVVDYAHKPDAVAAALAALRPVTAGRLIIVIGAGGDRDHGKRPLMGQIAADLADVVVITDDNPRTEVAAQIRAEVLVGARQGTRAEVAEVGDRRTAIEYAVSLAEAGDTVLVAGKGHETGQEIDGAVHPFDDRVVLAEAIAARKDPRCSR